MCVHYVIEQSDSVINHAKSVADVFELHGENLPANAWPRAHMPVVAVLNGKNTLTSMRWGVSPWYLANMGKTDYVVNARDDSLLTKSIWKAAVQTRRCLIPADGFYEWAGPMGAKYEVFFRLLAQRPFFFAGLWSSIGDKRFYAIVTGKPNDLVAAIPHNRMPVILDGPHAREWLGATPISERDLSRLCLPFPASEMIRQYNTD